MASTWPTLNTLRISKLFVTLPTKQRCCYEIKKELNLPEESVRAQLVSMRDHNWLDADASKARGKAPPQIFYRITDFGMSAARAALREVQMAAVALSS